jgi:hypothetical protein
MAAFTHLLFKEGDDVRIATLCTVVVSVLLSTAAAAHHSFAMFDNTKEATINGTVKEVQWTNPHIWIQLISRDSAGKDSEWSIEGSSPNNLTRKGWSRNSLKVGDKIAIVIHPLKNGDKGGSLIKAMVNGQTLN